MTDYRVFGLRVRSDIELPELRPVAEAGDPDVTIRLSNVDADCSAPGIHVIEGGLLFVAEDVARYRVCDGKSILVEQAAGAPEQNVRLFLLGSAFGALLHQRGLLPLHANAVDFGGKAIAFMGESGAGKSTLAAWFHDRGYPILADDVCAIGFDDQRRPRVQPGFPRLRLWLDALESSGRSAAGLQQSYAGPGLDKYDLPVAPEAAADRELPLAALVLLERGEAYALESITGLAAAECVFANTYRGGYVETTGTHREHWVAAVEVSRAVQAYRFVRTMRFEDFDAECARLLKDLPVAAG